MRTQVRARHCQRAREHLAPFFASPHPGPENLDVDGGARWKLPGCQGLDGALLDFTPGI